MRFVRAPLVLLLIASRYGTSSSCRAADRWHQAPRIGLRFMSAKDILLRGT
jgi:hypothetical protein